MKNLIKCTLSLIIVLLFSCNKKTEPILNKKIDSVTVLNAKNDAKIDYSSATINEETALKIKKYILKNYLKPEDLRVIETKDRKFSFYEIDLNGDSKNEFFIKLHGNYFRGSGGGTFLLLSNDMEVKINNFTVMNEPIFKSSAKTNGWNDLILCGDFSENDGVKNYIHLKYDKLKNKYPSNPSLEKKINIAPSGHDFVMWHKEFSIAKEFKF